MNARRNFILMLSLLTMSVTVLTGCPPKKNKKEVLRTGRTARSPVGAKQPNGTPGSYQSGNPNTVWGGVTGFDQQSWNSYIQYFAMPALAGAAVDQQLGNVSMQPMNGYGFGFWGNVVIGAGGQIDSARSRIHVEIFDDKYGQIGSDGQPISQFFYHIGPEQEGFIGVQGNANSVSFLSSYGHIMLQGQNQGGQFVGTFYFANSYTSNEYVPLGQFQVQSNGFFSNF